MFKFFKLIVTVLEFFGLWKLFAKMNEESWKSIIPCYNEYILYKDTYDLKSFWIYMACDIVSSIIFAMDKPNLLFSLIGLVLGIVVIAFQWKAATYVCKSFGKNDSLYFWLTFLFPSISYIMLGFDDSVKYLGNFFAKGE